MTTSTLQQSNLLRTAIRANSVFSTITGIVLTIGAGVIAPFMGISTPAPLIIVGIGTIGFALLMFYETSREPVNLSFGRLVFALDAGWVVASLIILALNLFGLTTGGRWLVLIVSDFVALFAIAEFIGLRRSR